ncbi:MAG: CRISPR system precrRNA processing endoribonuclease RAMP protein Cas6 [Candidatus Accumulibacter sp.]|jgi:hypothetical protein|nr:CRISPR system precrRNA processing endoribonuclease RAMP protein Cas6 [Accumulibacter sp.]
MMPTSIPIARLHFHFIAETPIKLPDWPASMVRGAFGHALRRLSCMTRQRECGDCPLSRTCPYPAIFAPPPLEHRIQRFAQPPVPYLIAPESRGPRLLEKGEPLCFGMTLMGRALREMPLVVEAMKLAARRGLGAGGGTAELGEVALSPCAEESVAETLYRPAEDKRLRDLPLPVLTVSPPPPALDRLTLRFHTPLRLQNNGHALAPAKLTAAALLTTTVKRVALLAELYGNGVPAWDFKALARQAAEIADEKSLRWQDWSRYSSRQDQVMRLGGVLGTWRLSGNLAAFFPALFMGQWLGTGKETVFGLGRYRLLYDAS